MGILQLIFYSFAENLLLIAECALAELHPIAYKSSGHSCSCHVSTNY